MKQEGLSPNQQAIMGTNLDREHSWHESLVYGADDNLVGREGEVTEGERQGKNWRREFTTETMDNYTKKTETETGQRLQDGELIDYTATRINYFAEGANDPS